MFLHSLPLITSLCLCWTSARTRPESASHLMVISGFSHSFSKSSFTPRFLRNSRCYLICVGPGTGWTLNWSYTRPPLKTIFCKQWSQSTQEMHWPALEKTLEWLYGLRLAWPENMGLMDNATLPSVGLFLYYLKGTFEVWFDGSWWNVDINVVGNIYRFISWCIVMDMDG